jgi:Zn-dependent peptidase ImmA (M78 family)
MSSGEPRVDVVAVAARHHIQVSKQRLPKDVSGLLLRDDKSSAIVVNNAHASVRQRFTVAHELGHYLLHKGIFLNSTTQVYLRAEIHGRSRYEEIEANQFAAELLMPEIDVLQQLQATLRGDPRLSEESLVQRMARVFDVSVPAMSIRLGVLGIITSA